LNYGLLQLSDKLDGGDFDEDDEQHLKRLAELAAMALDALAKVRKLRGGEAVPFRSARRLRVVRADRVGLARRIR
jgi:GAF domain-containing protein